MHPSKTFLYMFQKNLMKSVGGVAASKTFSYLFQKNLMKSVGGVAPTIACYGHGYGRAGGHTKGQP